MRIVELGDYSMTVMKDSEDPPWVSVGDIYRMAYSVILVDKGNQLTYECIESSDSVYSAGRLVLFFKDKIPSNYHLHDKVYLEAL